MACVYSNLANCYVQLDRYEDALEIKRLVYAAALRMKESEEVIFSEALNLSVALILTGNTAEAITFLGERTLLHSGHSGAITSSR